MPLEIEESRASASGAVPSASGKPRPVASALFQIRNTRIIDCAWRREPSASSGPPPAGHITLLFAFFVVLYASSQVNKRRGGRLAPAIQLAFRELGVFESSNTHVPLSNSEAMPFSDVQAVENVQRTADMEPFVQPMKGILSPALGSAPLKDIQQELEKALAPEIQNKVVDIKPRKEGLVVSLREMGFYDSGSSTMRASSLGSVDRLAGVLAPRGESLRIEGHPDNVPIHNAHFPSNWELSTARATELVKLFMYGHHVAPSRLSAAAFAEFHPVAENTTPSGRARNSRIDIVILNPPAFQAAAPLLSSPQGSLTPAFSAPRAVPSSAQPAGP